MLMRDKAVTSDNSGFEKAFTVSACILLLLSPVLEVITAILIRLHVPYLMPGILQPYLIGSFGVLGTVLILYYFAYGIKNKTFRFGACEYFYISLTLFSLISLVFTRRYFGSVNHPWWYREGFEDFLAYYFLFYSASKIRSMGNKLKLFYSFMAAAVLNAVFALLQSFGINISYCLMPPPMFEGMNYAYGFTSNPNYYGGLSVIFLAIACGAFLFARSFTESKVFSISSLILASVLFYTSLASRARLAWVGCFCLLAFYLVSLLVTGRKELAKRAFILLGCLVLTLLATFFFTDFIGFNIERTGGEIASSEVSYDIGSRRLYLWRFALESVPGNFFTGVGLDNFDAVFFDSPRWKAGMYWKGHCHNEYLHTLATQGVPAFLNQVTLLALTVIYSVKAVKRDSKSKSNVLIWLFLGALVTYLGKAVFDSSVIATSIYVWPLIGFCLQALPAKDQR